MNFQTSGTKGAKPFILSELQMQARAARIARTSGYNFASLKSLYCDFPRTSTTFEHYRRAVEAQGGKIYSNARSVDYLVELIQSEQPDGIIGNPSRLVMLGNILRGRAAFKQIIALGARCSPRHSQVIRQTLGENLIGLYGTSEIGMIALATPDQMESVVGCVGKPFDDLFVEIEDGQLRVKPKENYIGLISCYANPSHSAKYLIDGWFYPGDQARFDGDLLVVEGRCDYTPTKSVSREQEALSEDRAQYGSYSG